MSSRALVSAAVTRTEVMWEQLIGYVGFRGGALILFGVAYVGVGMGIVASPAAAPELFYSQLPVIFRALLWIGVGLFSLLAAIVEKPRWQNAGFGALFVPTGERLAAYLGALVDPIDNALIVAIGTAFLFLMVCILVGLMSPEWRRRAVGAGVVTAAVLNTLMLIPALMGHLQLRWLAGAMIYSLFSGLIALIASWPEPAPAPAPPDEVVIE
ncbi:hypothetical protein GCM10009616_35630 [Microlunatus lacustris]